MTKRPRRATKLFRTSVIVLTAALSFVVLNGASTARGDPSANSGAPLALSVALHATGGTLAAGSDVGYTASVTNDGADAATIRLAVEVPTYVTTRAHHHTTAWTVTVRPGRTVRRSMHARVGHIPSDQQRVIGLASVYRHGSTAPLARTTVVSPIRGVPTAVPSGGRPNTAVGSPSAVASHPRANARHDGLGPLAISAIAVVAAVLLGFVATFWWRQRRAIVAATRSAPTSPSTSV